MNRNCLLAFSPFLFGILFFAGCASMLQRPVTHTTPTPEEFGKIFPEQELKSDLHMLMETLEAVHPSLYAYTSKSEIDSLRRDLEEHLTTPMARREFYFKIAPLVARIGDGHTSVRVPWEEYSHFRSREGGLAFPFNIAFDSLAGVTITRNYSNDSVVSVGDHILSINGRSADSLFAFFLHGFSGERMVFRQQNVAGSLRLLLWLNKVCAPYDLIVRQRGGQNRIARHIEGVTLQDVLTSDSLFGMGSTILPDYRFERLQDSIGYIDFRSMSNLERFEKFLSVIFADIRAHPIRGLVVDLRNNGGGDSQLGSALLSFLTDSSYRMAERKEWKMSAQYKAYMRQMIPWWIRWFPFTWVSSDARHYFGAADGEIIVDSSLAEAPGENPLRYRGRTCILIGPGTFSSAMMLSDAIADYRIATLIGEETGGIPTAYGEVYSFDLPNTKLSTGVSSAFYVRANGNRSDRRGIMPDIEVHQTETDARSAKDTVLERAKLWILGGR